MKNKADASYPPYSTDIKYNDWASQKVVNSCTDKNYYTITLTNIAKILKFQEINGHAI